MTVGRSGQAPPTLTGTAVLIVEDQALVALDLALTLHDLGCIVLGPAADSAQTLALLWQRPDAVLLDLGLRDGFALSLVESLAAVGTPLLVLTTGYDGEQREHPILCHAPRLDKPYGQGELRQALLRVLGH